MNVFRRPLLPSLLAFILGLYVCRELLPLAPLAVAIVLTGCGLAALVHGRRLGNSTSLFLVLAATAGVLRMAPTVAEQSAAQRLLSEIQPNRPRAISGQVVAAEYDDELQDLQSLVLKNVRVTSGSESLQIPGKVSVLVSRNSSDRNSGAPPLLPGTLIRVFGTIASPDSYHNFYGRSRSEILALRRTYAAVRVRSPALLEPGGASDELAPGIRASLLRARKAADRILSDALPSHHSRLFRCMLFSDLRLLEEEDLRIFRDSGTMHLFAVSGMHVAIMAFILNAVFRAFRVRPRASWILVLAILFAYVWLLDFIAPALRAWLMVFAYVAGRLLGREVDPLSALLFGTGAILVVEPLALWNAGFQLSIAGVASIVLFVPLFRQWLHMQHDDHDRREWLSLIGNGGADLLAVTLSVTIGLLPLQLYLFHQINLLAPLANLLEALLAGPVLSAGIAILVLGSFAPSVAEFIGHGTAMLMELVYQIAVITAKQDWALLHLRQMPFILLLFCYGVLCSGYYMVWRKSPEFSLKSRARLTLHTTACIAVLAGYGAWERTAKPLRLWFFDVGQGDSTLIELPGGQSLLIDAGHITPDLGKLVVLPQLRGAGIWPLHAMVATHADADHTGGIPAVLKQHQVRRYYTSDARPASDPITSSIQSACLTRGIPMAVLRAGEIIEADGGVRLEILNPPPGEGAEHDNNQSLVIRITYGEFTALLMADAEKEVEERLVHEGIDPVTLLKVGHHGSRTSSTGPFIEAARPQLAIVSCGRNNRYGHPHPDVLDRLHSCRARVLRTDLLGAILVETRGSSYKVRTARVQHKDLPLQ